MDRLAELGGLPMQVVEESRPIWRRDVREDDDHIMDLKVASRLKIMGRLAGDVDGERILKGRHIAI
jgi:hypothetical protein